MGRGLGVVMSCQLKGRKCQQKIDTLSAKQVYLRSTGARQVRPMQGQRLDGGQGAKFQEILDHIQNYGHYNEALNYLQLGVSWAIIRPT